jgi:hypothetical protein
MPTFRRGHELFRSECNVLLIDFSPRNLVTESVGRQIYLMLYTARKKFIFLKNQFPHFLEMLPEGIL